VCTSAPVHYEQIVMEHVRGPVLRRTRRTSCTRTLTGRGGGTDNEQSSTRPTLTRRYNHRNQIVCIW